MSEDYYPYQIIPNVEQDGLTDDSVDVALDLAQPDEENCRPALQDLFQVYVDCIANSGEGSDKPERMQHMLDNDILAKIKEIIQSDAQALTKGSAARLLSAISVEGTATTGSGWAQQKACIQLYLAGCLSDNQTLSDESSRAIIDWAKSSTVVFDTLITSPTIVAAPATLRQEIPFTNEEVASTMLLDRKILLNLLSNLVNEEITLPNWGEILGAMKDLDTMVQANEAMIRQYAGDMLDNITFTIKDISSTLERRGVQPVAAPVPGGGASSEELQEARSMVDQLQETVTQTQQQLDSERADKDGALRELSAQQKQVDDLQKKLENAETYQRKYEELTAKFHQLKDVKDRMQNLFEEEHKVRVQVEAQLHNQRNEFVKIQDAIRTGKPITTIKSLDETQCRVANPQILLRNNNIISHSAEQRLEMVSVGPPLTKGVNRITFRLLKRGGTMPIFAVIGSELAAPQVTSPPKPDLKAARYYSGNGKTTAPKGGSNSCDKAPENAIVVMELDLRSEDQKERTLCWIVNDKKMKTVVTNLPAFLNFAVYMEKSGESVEFLSFDTLVSPTPIYVEKPKELDWTHD